MSANAEALLVSRQRQALYARQKGRVNLKRGKPRGDGPGLTFSLISSASLFCRFLALSQL